MKDRTISKHFNNSEILFRDTNGDLHLKPGVTRLGYGDHIRPDDFESHINYEDIRYRKSLRDKDDFDPDNELPITINII